MLGCIGFDDCQHVSSDRVELLIEVVSQRVNAVKTIGRRLGVAAIERGKQALDLGIELTAGIGHRRIDAAIESSERGFVAQRLPFLDKAIDQCASGASFPLDLHAFGVAHVADDRRRVAARWRLEFFDDRPAKRKGPLEGADIRAREAAIGRDVAVRQLLQAMTDLDHPHH